MIIVISIIIIIGVAMDAVIIIVGTYTIDGCQLFIILLHHLKLECSFLENNNSLRWHRPNKTMTFLVNTVEKLQRIKHTNFVHRVNKLRLNNISTS